MVQALYLAAPEPARLTPQRRNMTGIDAKLPLVNGSYRPKVDIQKRNQFISECDSAESFYKIYVRECGRRRMSVAVAPIHLLSKSA